jgi:hypothetical protein
MTCLQIVHEILLLSQQLQNISMEVLYEVLYNHNIEQRQKKHRHIDNKFCTLITVMTFYSICTIVNNRSGIAMD